MRSLGQRVWESRCDWLRAGRPHECAPQLRLLTLTCRPGATCAETRDRIAHAWPTLRRWLRDRLGYAPPYCGTWELGGPLHAHLHLCIALPWVSYRALGAEWERATGGKAEDQGADVRTIGVKQSARYVAGYITASTLDGRNDVDSSAAWVAATYARRLVLASRGFWAGDKPGVPCGCGAPCTVRLHRRPPEDLRRAAPGPAVVVGPGLARAPP